jgi:uncharacterized protein YecE (DUF72 family)
VKVPKTITHERRLVDFGRAPGRFLDECAGWAASSGPLLIQLPPSLQFDAEMCRALPRRLAQGDSAATVLEPRHPTWFETPAETLLRTFQVARVGADPAVVPAAAEPGGWPGLTYRRLHGSPVMYKTPYDDGRLEPLAEADRRRDQRRRKLVRLRQHPARRGDHRRPEAGGAYFACASSLNVCVPMP